MKKCVKCEDTTTDTKVCEDNPECMETATVHMCKEDVLLCNEHADGLLVPV